MVYLLIAWWISMAEFVRTWPWQPGWIRPLWPACSWDRRGWWVVDKKRVAWCFQWCFQWVKYGDWTMNYGCFLGFKHEFHGWTIKMEIRSMNMVLLQCIYCIYIYTLCVCENIDIWYGIYDQHEPIIRYRGVSENGGKTTHGNGVFQLGNAWFTTMDI